MKEEFKISIDKFVFSILLIMCLSCIVFNYYPIKCICFLIIFIEIYQLFKVRKNNFLLFIYLCLLYFDYSVIFGKYLGEPISRLSIVYSQIPEGSMTRSIGIMCILLFHIILALFLPKVKESKKINFFAKNISNKFASIIIVVLTMITVIGYIVLPSIFSSRQLYEYSIIFFCIGFFMTRNNKILFSFLILFMMVSTIVNMYEGGRVISLLPMISYFTIFTLNNMKPKGIVISFISIVLIFTFFGLYGDLAEEKRSLTSVSINDLITTINDRKFTLDTSVSSYWTGLTYIDITNKYNYNYRISNFNIYLTNYTLLGGKSNYEHLYYLTRKNYVHYYGGYLTSYFYFWGGYIGVILISLFISYFLKLINNLDNNSSDLKKIICVYFISTLPRWYLYYPTPLIRGLIILLIVYYILVRGTLKEKKI